MLLLRLNKYPFNNLLRGRRNGTTPNRFRRLLFSVDPHEIGGTFFQRPFDPSIEISRAKKVSASKKDGAADCRDGLKPVPTIRYSQRSQVGTGFSPCAFSCAWVRPRPMKDCFTRDFAVAVDTSRGNSDSGVHPLNRCVSRMQLVVESGAVITYLSSRSRGMTPRACHGK